MTFEWFKTFFFLALLIAVQVMQKSVYFFMSNPTTNSANINSTRRFMSHIYHYNFINYKHFFYAYIWLIFNLIIKTIIWLVEQNVISILKNFVFQCPFFLISHLWLRVKLFPLCLPEFSWVAAAALSCLLRSAKFNLRFLDINVIPITADSLLYEKVNGDKDTSIKSNIGVKPLHLSLS